MLFQASRRVFFLKPFVKLFLVFIFLEKHRMRRSFDQSNMVVLFGTFRDEGNFHWVRNLIAISSNLRLKEDLNVLVFICKYIYLRCFMSILHKRRLEDFELISLHLVHVEIIFKNSGIRIAKMRASS